MEPRISNLREENGFLKFTLLDCNMSIANALRRIIVSDIPTFVFRTYPYSENNANNANKVNNANNVNKDLCFHIYSQGNIENFNCYKNDDVILHIDEDVTTTFIGLVGSDILVMSASSFSYIAAILTDAEVYYLPFWHKPKKEWIIL